MATKKLKTKISRLEAIADALEENEQDIEKSLALFQEGMQLIRECNGDLDGIEEKVMVLTADTQKGMREMPYEGEIEG